MPTDREIIQAADRVFEANLPFFKQRIEQISAKLAPVCESSIELMLATAFAVGDLLVRSEKRFVQFAAQDAAYDLSAAWLTIIPQFKWESYRIDFCVKYQLSDGSDAMVFVECDGHDFHERTKEQAERDRRKDREIQEANISILRFTGREIYRDPDQCAGQIATFIEKKVR